MQSIGEKVKGIKEEVKGKVTGDPELVELGRERRTGELRLKEQREKVGITFLH